MQSKLHIEKLVLLPVEMQQCIWLSLEMMQECMVQQLWLSDSLW